MLGAEAVGPGDCPAGEPGRWKQSCKRRGMSARLHLPPIWREGLLPLEYRSLGGEDLFRDPPAAAHGLPVLLIPGFLTGDMHLGALSGWLQRCGHRTHTSGMRLNVDC